MQTRTRHGIVSSEEAGAPDAPPIVLLHANPGDRRDWDGVAPALARRYRVIAVDWPGYGDSPPPDPPSSASAMMYADVAMDLAAAWGLEGAIFIGNSVGGYAALRVALEAPRCVGGLVLVDTGGFTAPSWLTRSFCRLKGTEALTRRFGPRFTRHYLKIRTRFSDAMIARADDEVLTPARVAVDAAIWRSFARPEHDLRVRVAGLSTPTLLVWGKRDPVLAPEREGRDARRRLPHARWVELDTGHAVFAEDPEGFLAAVEPFLAEVARGRAAA